MRLEAEQKASGDKLGKLQRESAALMEGNRELQSSVSDKLGPTAGEKPEGVLRLEDKLKGLAEKNAVLRRVFMVSGATQRERENPSSDTFSGTVWWD